MDDLVASAMASWFETCHLVGVGLADATAMGETLVEAYGEPHRRYHTLEHVKACLDWAAEAPLDEVDLPIVALALWFHDAVYEPRRDDNEARSARMASDWMRDRGVAGADRVEALILMTAGHRLDAEADLATKVVHDVDLAILGAPENDYRRYADGIRHEYGWLDAKAFARGRAEVLQGFLDTDTIYSLEAYRGALEHQARTNLAGELDELGEEN